MVEHKHVIGKTLSYPAELLAPIDADSLKMKSLILGQSVDQALLEELHAKHKLLAAHYKIRRDDPMKDFKLLLAVLRDWVPGFAIGARADKKRRGAPHKNSLDLDVELVTKIDQIVKGQKCTVIEACKQFKKSHRGERWSNTTPAAIKNRYNIVKRTLTTTPSTKNGKKASSFSSDAKDALWSRWIAGASPAKPNKNLKP
ncbi:hypothetical protein [Aestuariivirga sp.]|uniref:hypothetical protein n=1 Tax=Aestuariivirga sp. TaxID=2650926 RepID=UPI0039E6390E